MHFSALLSVVALLPFAWAQDTDLRVVQATFEKYNIPRDLGINFKPTSLLNVILPQSNSATRPVVITAGDEVRLNVTYGPPQFALGVEPVTTPIERRYVVVAIDPDAPTPQRPSWAQVRHFLGGSFVHLDTAPPIPIVTVPLLSNRTEAVTEWVRPTPPTTALNLPHRYIFLVYRESQAFRDQILVTPDTPIIGFDIARFAKATELGDPIAGTFFLSKTT